MEIHRDESGRIDQVLQATKISFKTNAHLLYLLTYLLHGAESFLRSYLVLQLINKFPAFYGTRKFITVLTSARHLSLSLANSIQSPQSLPTSSRSVLVLSSYLRLGLPNGFFPSGFPTFVHTSPFLHTCHMPRPSHSSRFLKVVTMK